MKKEKIARIHKLEKKLTTLMKIKYSPRLKRKLRKMARDWINWTKQHMEDIKHPSQSGYHQGQIDILEILFNLKNEKSKNNKRKREDS